MKREMGSVQGKEFKYWGIDGEGDEERKETERNTKLRESEDKGR